MGMFSARFFASVMRLTDTGWFSGIQEGPHLMARVSRPIFSKNSTMPIGSYPALDKVRMPIRSASVSFWRVKKIDACRAAAWPPSRRPELLHHCRRRSESGRAWRARWNGHRLLVFQGAVQVLLVMCAISCASTPATSFSSSAARIRPL